MYTHTHGQYESPPSAPRTQYLLRLQDLLLRGGQIAFQLLSARQLRRREREFGLGEATLQRGALVHADGAGLRGGAGITGGGEG